MTRKLFTFCGNVKAVQHLLLPRTEYWKAETKDIRSYLYRFFPNDYVGRIDLTKHFHNADGTFKQFFLDDFDLRIFWEIVSEFGLMTSVGRSLEKTGSSASYFKQEDVDATYEAMKPWLEESMSGTTKEQFDHFLIGFLERSLLHGAIAHPFMETYRKTLRWRALNCYHEHVINRCFGEHDNLPQPLVTYERRGIGDSTYVNQTGWYYSYFQRCFDRALHSQLISNDFYVKVAEALTRVGIFDKVLSSEGPNYCINPAKIHLSTKVRIYRCSHCQSALFTSDTDTLSLGTPCIVRNCQGSYTQIEEPKSDYYRRIWPANGGILHLKSDSDFLYEYLLETAKEQRWELLEDIPDVYAGGADPLLTEVQTFYEKMWLAEGKTIHYVRLKT